MKHLFSEQANNNNNVSFPWWFLGVFWLEKGRWSTKFSVFDHVLIFVEKKSLEVKFQTWIQRGKRLHSENLPTNPPPRHHPCLCHIASLYIIFLNDFLCNFIFSNLLKVNYTFFEFLLFATTASTATTTIVPYFFKKHEIICMVQRLYEKRYKFS